MKSSACHALSATKVTSSKAKPPTVAPAGKRAAPTACRLNKHKCLKTDVGHVDFEGLSERLFNGFKHKFVSEKAS